VIVNFCVFAFAAVNVKHCLFDSIFYWSGRCSSST